jgi:hypothetical protein
VRRILAAAMRVVDRRVNPDVRYHERGQQAEPTPITEPFLRQQVEHFYSLVGELLPELRERAFGQGGTWTVGRSPRAPPRTDMRPPGQR